MARGMSGITGIIVGIIMIVAVAVPISISTVTAQNWTSFSDAQTIAELIPLGLAVGALMLAFSVVG